MDILTTVKDLKNLRVQTGLFSGFYSNNDQINITCPGLRMLQLFSILFIPTEFILYNMQFFFFQIIQIGGSYR